jgi:uncharacterized membrane protein
MTMRRLLLEPGYRLLTSLVAAVLTFLLSPWPIDTGSRTVLAWDIGVTLLLALIAVMMWRTEPHETLRRARKEETSSVVMLLVTVVAVAGALVDIGYGLPKTKGMSQAMRVFGICASVAGVFLAWLLLHVVYALHYAKLYYGEMDDDDAFRKGLAFPGNQDAVDYWDFVYYSFTIAMCFQTSDVTITSPYMRRLTTFHATISYLFNLAILGLLLDGFVTEIS